MSMQQIMRWGNDFLRIRRGKYLTFGSNGEKTNVKGRTHEIVNYVLSCLIHPIIKICQNVVELVIAWSGKSIGRNSNWAGDPFLKNVF